MIWSGVFHSPLCSLFSAIAFLSGGPPRLRMVHAGILSPPGGAYDKIGQFPPSPLHRCRRISTLKWKNTLVSSTSTPRRPSLSTETSLNCQNVPYCASCSPVVPHLLLRAAIVSVPLIVPVVAVSESCLLLGREDGTICRYTLPHISLENRFVCCSRRPPRSGAQGRRVLPSTAVVVRKSFPFWTPFRRFKSPRRSSPKMFGPRLVDSFFFCLLGCSRVRVLWPRCSPR